MARSTVANDIQSTIKLWGVCFVFLLKVITSSPLNTFQAFQTPCLKGSVALLFIRSFPEQ